MCPLRFLVALLSLIALLFCLAMVLSDDGETPTAMVLRRLRGLSWWRFIVSFFTGEFLYALWRGPLPSDSEDKPGFVEPSSPSDGGAPSAAPQRGGGRGDGGADSAAADGSFSAQDARVEPARVSAPAGAR